MNACREWTDRLLDHALSALAPADARAVEAHLAGCPACTGAFWRLRTRATQLDAAVRRLVRDSEPSPAFPARVLAGIRARPAAPRRWRFALLGGLVLAGLVAAVVELSPRSPRARPLPARSGAAIAPSAGISAWRSPTGSLLHFSSEELLESTPNVGEAYLTAMPAAIRSRK